MSGRVTLSSSPERTFALLFKYFQIFNYLLIDLDFDILNTLIRESDINSWRYTISKIKSRFMRDRIWETLRDRFRKKTGHSQWASLSTGSFYLSFILFPGRMKIWRSFSITFNASP